ncbi:hypothetical protein D3C71_1799730 [compost metagenome]
MQQLKGDFQIMAKMLLHLRLKLHDLCMFFQGDQTQQAPPVIADHKTSPVPLNQLRQHIFHDKMLQPYPAFTRLKLHHHQIIAAVVRDKRAQIQIADIKARSQPLKYPFPQEAQTGPQPLPLPG